jgi:hypothetical protein
MSSNDFHDVLLTPGIAQSDDPPQIVSGMVNVELDPQGRLIYFQAIPPEKEESTASTSSAFDWKILFALSGLDPAQFQTAPPVWNSLAGGDTRAAWTGKWPGTERPLRIEAAAYRGKPVFFSLIGEWTKPERQKADDNSTSTRIRTAVMVFLLIAMLSGASFFARRNYRQGRGDREGAVRLASVMFGLEILLWLCRSHMVAGIETLGLFILAASTALFLSGVTWLLYLALEPWVRRNWPQTIISWSRLLAGKGRDPLVGRDILFGVLLGVLWMLIFQVRYIFMMRMGAAPGLYSTDYLLGSRQALGAWLSQMPSAILGALEFFFLLLGLKKLLRKDWIAALAFIAIFTGLNSGDSTFRIVTLPTQVLVYAVAVLIVYRFGLVPLACAIFTIDMLSNVPFSADFSAWYMPTSIFMLSTVVALAGWGFYHSLGGEPLWQSNSE